MVAEDPGALAHYLRLRKMVADWAVTPPPYVAVLPFETSGFREGVRDIERGNGRLAECRDGRRFPVAGGAFRGGGRAVGERRDLKPEEAFEIGPS